MKKFFQRLLISWKKVIKKIVWVQSTVILFLFYFLVMGIFSLILKILQKDLLDKKIREKKSFWKEKEKVKFDLESFKHQF